MTLYRVGILAIAFLLFLTACQSPTIKATTSARRPAATAITDQRLPEISGLAASQIHPNELFAINDSGNSPSIFLIDRHLSVKKEIALDINNRDWEDLAAFSWHGEPWIVIAESGDNLHRYKNYHLYFYRESALLSSSSPLPPTVNLSYTYDSGPVNCEAIAVDTSSETILLFGKTNKDTPVYSIALSAIQTDTPVEAKLVATIPAYSNSPANSLISALTGVNLDSTTAATISDSGKNLFLLTYNDIWRIERKLNQSWKSAFQEKATHIASHGLRQAEALTSTSTSQKLWVTSEELPAPMLTFDY